MNQNSASGNSQHLLSAALQRYYQIIGSPWRQLVASFRLVYGALTEEL